MLWTKLYAGQGRQIYLETFLALYKDSLDRVISLDSLAKKIAPVPSVVVFFEDLLVFKEI